MPTITVSQEVYDRLAARAAARGVTVEDELAEDAVPIPQDLSLAEWQRLFDRHTAIVQARAKSYPPGFECDVSREAMYEGCGE